MCLREGLNRNKRRLRAAFKEFYGTSISLHHYIDKLSAIIKVSELHWLRAARGDSGSNYWRFIADLKTTFRFCHNSEVLSAIHPSIHPSIVYSYIIRLRRLDCALVSCEMENIIQKQSRLYIVV